MVASLFHLNLDSFCDSENLKECWEVSSHHFFPYIGHGVSQRTYRLAIYQEDKVGLVLQVPFIAMRIL